MIRVLWLAKGLGPGGMERLLETHARVGDRSIFEFEAAYLVERPHSIVGSLEELGVPVHRLEGGLASWPRQLRRLVAEHRIDVVHTHSPMVAALARPVLRSMRNRPALVYTEHNSWDCYGTATRLANAATYRLDDEQLAVSAAAATSAPAVLRPRMRELTHGIDVARLQQLDVDRAAIRERLGIGVEAKVVITVAHLRAEKGYEVWLEAAKRVTEAREDVVFVSVGHGPLEAELREQHRRLGLDDRVRFLGFRDDAVELLAAADVCCFASHSEGLPVVVMEAAALGVPIVATAVGGLVGAIDDGVSGRLVPPGDPQALADALSDVLGDDDVRKQMGEAMRSRAGRYDAIGAIDVIEALYREVHAAHRGAGHAEAHRPGDAV